MFPESTTAKVVSVKGLPARDPLKDHCHPVAAKLEPEACTSAGAEYLYIFEPQIVVLTGVIVIFAGAAVGARSVSGV